MNQQKRIEEQTAPFFFSSDILTPPALNQIFSSTKMSGERRRGVVYTSRE